MKTERAKLIGNVVAAVMREYGKHSVWQNVYYTGTRSVKCYSAVQDTALTARLNRVMDALKVPGHAWDISFTRGSGYCRMPAFIVKIFPNKL